MKIAIGFMPIALMLGACQPAQPNAPDADPASLAEPARKSQLAGAGEQWRIAYEAGNWDAVRALYADDAILMTQGSEKIEGADNIAAFLKRLSDSGGSAKFRFENEEVTVGPAGETGFVIAKYRMDISFPGSEPTVVAGRSFLVYKWQDEEWKLWRDIDNLAPDAVAEDFTEETAE